MLAPLVGKQRRSVILATPHMPVRGGHRPLKHDCVLAAMEADLCVARARLGTSCPRLPDRVAPDFPIGPHITPLHISSDGPRNWI